jgi:YidC/Oxa1 family membrane protein insertase
VIAVAVWQSLLDGLGWVVAQIYALIPNYGVTIILLTLLIRLVLLPLGIKQIRSMQHMQLVQPKIKALQQKYKTNKQKQQEEIMKVYKEYGVNPFSGCWPVLLQFPILIAMYAVLRHPQHPVHIPAGTDLYNVIQEQVPQPPLPSEMAKLPGPPGGTTFLWMNLLCAAREAGSPNATLNDTHKYQGNPIQYKVNCGSGVGSRIPFYVFVLLMFGTTYYQQRQMQKASPPGASSQQQQALLKIMPVFFGVFGYFVPAGLVIYWTTSNAWQIGQQYFMLRTRPSAEELAARADGKKNRKGFFSSLMDRAGEEQRRRQGQGGPPGKTGPSGKSPDDGGSSQPPARPPRKPGPGGSGGGSRKKRPKR